MILELVKEKVFLLLQGPPCRFAYRLATCIEQQGHRCYRINLCLGDWLFWLGKKAHNYRGNIQHWPLFLKEFVLQHGITDIIYYADRLPYHKAARDLANNLGINAVAYEHGYLRPNWITVERGGMSRFSHFPDSGEHIKEVGMNYPKPTSLPGLSHDFWKEAVQEVVFNLANFFDFIFFPHYLPDKIYNPLVEYLNYIPRFLGAGKKHKRTAQVFESLRRSGQKYFVFPLQMQNDYQLRDNSPFNHQLEAIAMVVEEFSQHAPADTVLLFKIHPLDNGIEPWEKMIARLGQEHDVADRLLLVDGGILKTMLAHSSGVITVNSTVGVQALEQGKPVKVLGYAIYDIDGMTCQRSMGEFFAAPEVPDKELVDCFLRLLGGTIQVHGNFYSQQGQLTGASEVTNWLLTGSVKYSDAFFDQPPRLLKDKAYG